MSNASDQGDGLTRVIAAHGAIGYDDVDGCECGVDVSSREAHNAHVAEAIRQYLALVDHEPDAHQIVAQRGTFLAVQQYSCACGKLIESHPDIATEAFAFHRAAEATR